jgi:hypothetical protein
VSRGLVSGACGLTSDSLDYERKQQAQRSWDDATLDVRDAALVYKEVVGSHLRREREAEEQASRSRFV